jgi:tetratricopeptide (TPR) repeat protein
MLLGMRCSWMSIMAITAMASAASIVRPPNPAFYRAEELYNRTDYGRAIDALQTLDRRDAAAHALLGKAYFMQGRYKEAVASFEKAIADDGFNSDYHDWIGKAYGRLAEASNFLSALGYAKKTVRAFERAVELNPSNLEALSDVFEYYLEAPAMVGGGVDKAENIARRVSSLDQAESHWMRARLAEKRKDYQAAEREYRAAMASAPTQVGRVLDLADFLSSRGRYEESEAMFRAAEENYPPAPKVIYAHAAAYIQSRRNLDQAESLLKNYLDLEITPDDPQRAEVAALLKSARGLRSKVRQGE